MSKMELNTQTSTVSTSQTKHSEVWQILKWHGYAQYWSFYRMGPNYSTFYPYRLVAECIFKQAGWAYDHIPTSPAHWIHWW